MLFCCRVFHPDYKEPMLFKFDADSDYKTITMVLTDIQGVFSSDCCIEVFNFDMSMRLAVICGFSALNDYSEKCPFDLEYFVG